MRKHITLLVDEEKVRKLMRKTGQQSMTGAFRVAMDVVLGKYKLSDLPIWHEKPQSGMYPKYLGGKKKRVRVFRVRVGDEVVQRGWVVGEDWWPDEISDVKLNEGLLYDEVTKVFLCVKDGKVVTFSEWAIELLRGEEE